MQAQLDFPVVAIGASAGALEAVTRMFEKIETGTGMTFVLVAHLDPDRESMMGDLLSRKTDLNVRQIKDGDSLEIDCIHVIPPGVNLCFEQGKLRLDPFDEPRGIRRPIDKFFTSVAEAHGDKAACVVLSGTGADGAAGLRMIKEHGGVAVAQSPAQANHAGMPQSAIATNLVDFTLEAEVIASRLKSYFLSSELDHFVENDAASEKAMKSIFTALQDHVGTDFSGYKLSTLTRRLNRRMQVLEIDDLSNYLIKLKEEKSEQEALANDFLINVTSFFRDADHFELVRSSILRPLVDKSNALDEIRIWVPGCSSGQEAFSIAMMIEETCEELQKRPMVTIFATDVDRAMIEQGRGGFYPLSELGGIPERYREKYTRVNGDQFEISPRLREMVRFSVHNILQEPPFSKIDLISCRNLLIYLDNKLQRAIFSLLHFSLRQDGHLFLGNSESITRARGLFTPIDPKARIFKRNDEAVRSPIKLPMIKIAQSTGVDHGKSELGGGEDSPRDTQPDSFKASIYEQYAPPFVRVTRGGRIIESSGDLSLFLMSRPGDEGRLDVLARPALGAAIQPLIEEALNSVERRVLQNLEIASPFGVQRADVFAQPMKDKTVAVVFVVKDRLQPLADEFAMEPISRDCRISRLQEDLHAVRLALKAKLEEIEAANEELKSANEEMMSMNEELQSANEELTTANDELKGKIDELTLANADLDNFMHSADLTMIVLDRNLRIRHLTDPARRMLSVGHGEEGRSLSEFMLPTCGIDLLKQVRQVMDTGKVYSQTTKTDYNGRYFFFRISPYLGADQSVEGATMTMVDITQELELRSRLADNKHLLQLAMEAANMGSWITDLETGLLTIDETGAQLVGLDRPGEYDRSALFAHINPADVEMHVAERDKALAQNEGYSHTVQVDVPGAPRRWLRMHAVPVEGADCRKKVVGLAIDVTKSTLLQRELTEQTELRKLVMDAGRIGLGDLDVERSMSNVDEVMAEHLNLTEAGKIPFKDVLTHVVKEDAAAVREKVIAAIERGEEYEVDFRVNDPSVGVRWLRSRGRRYTTADGEKRVAGPTLDISAMKNQQMLVEEMSHRIKNLFAVVVGLIQAAPKHCPDTEQMAAELLNRVVSLGRVYDLARKDNSKRGVPLGSLLRSVLEPHATGHPISIESPTVFVDGDKVNTLTLIIHELTTNAVKYGALDASDGEIKLNWTASDDGLVELKWIESQKNFCPQSGDAGFGSLLIDTGVRQLKGSFTRSLLKDGAAIDLNFVL